MLTRLQSAFAAIAITAYSLLFSYGALKQGAVSILDSAFLSLAIALISFFYFLAFLPASSPPNTARLWILFSIPLIVGSLQLLPVPQSLVAAMFPYHREISRSLDPATPIPFTLVSDASVIWLIRLVSFLLVLLLARDLSCRLRNPMLLVLPVLIVAAWEAILGLLQTSASPRGTPANGTYVNRDHFAGLLEMAIPLAIMCAVAVYQQGKDRYEMSAGRALLVGLFMALGGIMLAAVIFSLSRMGFLAALGSLFFIGAVSSSALLSHRLPRKFRWAPIGFTAIIVLSVFLFLPTNELIARFVSTANSQDLAAESRPHIWHDSLPLFFVSPLIGTGLGSYESAFYHFQRVAPLANVAYAENDYLQGLIELGVLGFLPLAAVIVLALRGALKAGKGASDPVRWLGVGCAGSLIALLLHSFVDFNLHIPVNAMIFSWLCGMSLGLGSKPRKRTGSN